MGIIRKYTAIKVDTDTVNNEVQVALTYGFKTGPYYDQESPTELFDSEEEAISYIERTDEYATWLILPVIRFER